MRKIYFLLICAIACTSASAQQNVSPSVLAAGGGVSKYKDIELEWTLGEFFIGTAAAYSNMYTAGFHQPLLNKQSIKEDNPLAGTVNVFPNPVRDVVNINFQLAKSTTVKMIISDVDGKALLKRTILTQTTTTRIPVQQFTAGNYYITLYDEKGVVTNIFKIIKLN